MKKLLMLAAIFALVFTSCPTDEENNSGNYDVIGVWTGSFTYTSTTFNSTFNSTITLDIADGTWVLIENYNYTDGDSGGPNTYNGTWTRDANTLEFTYITKDHRGRDETTTFATASLSEDKLFFVWTIWQIERNYTLTKKAETPPGTTFLKIKNESSKTISDVLWNNVSFKRDSSNANIISGTNVTKSVEAGSGYIFFKVGTTAYRTKDLVVVEKDNEAEFTFIDYTLVVNVTTPDNTVTLGSL